MHIVLSARPFPRNRSHPRLRACKAHRFEKSSKSVSTARNSNRQGQRPGVEGRCKVLPPGSATKGTKVPKLVISITHGHLSERHNEMDPRRLPRE